eukprot:Blabericola_migrator_1__3992@NODE_220_length_11204_cov_64_408458_g187_i0_p4_GENE_NODE_220_length_11204_cov_64_408458_g187_i0NODE_220_length_11204_cov_64_408458_g187_i0_p4_ORF_typecomplete_len219_score19_77_NODE_220_length_11204_cov_64_408458_g187_i072497905
MPRLPCCYEPEESSIFCCARPVSRDIDDHEVLMTALPLNESLVNCAVDWASSSTHELRKFRVVDSENHCASLPSSLSSLRHLTCSIDDPEALLYGSLSTSERSTIVSSHDLSFLESPMTATDDEEDVDLLSDPPATKVGCQSKASFDHQDQGRRSYRWWKRNPALLFRPVPRDEDRVLSSLLMLTGQDSDESLLPFFDSAEETAFHYTSESSSEADGW